MSYTMLALVLHAARPLINIYMMAIVHDEHWALNKYTIL